MGSDCPKCGDNDWVLKGAKKRKRCRNCLNAYAREYQRAHPEHKRARLIRDPDYFRKEKLKSLYNLTIAEFNEMAKQQDGRCLICQERARLVVDHDHATQEVRGLLCRPCNAALSWVEKPAWIFAARRYLTRRRKPVPSTGSFDLSIGATHSVRGTK